MAKRIGPVTRKLTVADAVSEAFGEFETLGAEMREAYDNTPEGLKYSGVGEQRGEAADSLEDLQEPQIPDDVSALEFEYTEVKGTPKQEASKSRSARCGNAVALLEAVVDFLNSEVEEIEGQITELEGDKDGDNEAANLARRNKLAELNDLKDNIQSTVDELDNAKSDAESVSFPGMYG